MIYKGENHRRDRVLLSINTFIQISPGKYKSGIKFQRLSFRRRRKLPNFKTVGKLVIRLAVPSFVGMKLRRKRRKGEKYKGNRVGSSILEHTTQLSTPSCAFLALVHLMLTKPVCAKNAHNEEKLLS
jgi:hypothetical protein